MAKKKIQIKTAEQLIEALMEFATKDTKLDKAQFEEMAEERYQKNREIRHTRVTDFVNEKLFDKGDNIVDEYKIAKRVNDRAIQTDDISYAAFYAGISAVGARRLGKSVNIVLAPKYISFLDEFKENTDCEISSEAIAELRKLDRQAGRIMEDVRSDHQRLPLDQLPQITQDHIVANCMNAFFDKSIYAKDGEVECTPAMYDFFKEAVAEGKKFLKAAYGDNSFTPETPEQKAALDHMKQLAENHAKQDVLQDYQNSFETRISEKVENMLTNAEEYFIPSADMKFESVSLLKGMTKESFIANKYSRSYAETEYGETVVDNLMKQFYLDDEIKDMKRNGIEPCTYMYINGKSVLDLPCGETREVVDYGEDSAYNDGTKAVKMLTYREWFAEKGGEPTLLDYAKLKCDICAAALSGSQIDWVRLSKDENGKYAPHHRAVPVQVDAKDMDKEPVSLWKRILMFFGIIKDPDKEIAKSNQFESHAENLKKIKAEVIREKMNFNDMIADGAAPRTTEAVENDRQLEHANEL